MRAVRTLTVALTLIAATLGLDAAPAHAATYLGAGVTCYGAPTYGSQPLVNCSHNANRYAARTVYYRDPYNAAYCDVYVQYGSGYKWTWGTTFVMSSYTYVGYWRC